MTDTKKDSSAKIHRSKKKSWAPFSIEGGEIVISWKAIVMFLIVIGGGGTAGASLLPLIGGSPSQPFSPGQHETKHTVIDSTLEDHEHSLGEQGQVIRNVEDKLDSVLSVQHKQFARQEARRVTESISNPDKRIQEYDRMVDRNMRRLKRGDDPCGSLVCDN